VRLPDEELIRLVRPIGFVAFDFDGVFTDNSVWVDGFGTESVRFSRSDGWGIARMRDLGIDMTVLSGESNEVTARRCEKLKLQLFQDLDDKLSVLCALVDERGIDVSRVMYVGNDENDITCLEYVGLPVVVADAHPSAMSVAAFVLTRSGGAGAVREISDAFVACRRLVG
jgi:YrbI family 3-deoxy-D-manno-octulosonate 8-phosphate phosphatase